MSDQKLIHLQKETGCDVDLGRLILKFTGGDVDGAIKIIKSVDKNILIFRGKFISQTKKIYGAFLFFYDIKNKNIDKVTVAIKKEDKSAIEFDFDKSWTDYLNDLVEYSSFHIVEQDMQLRFVELIKSHKTMLFIDSKIANKREFDDKLLSNYIKEILVDVCGDLNIIVKFKVEKSDAFEVNKGNFKESDFENNEENDVSKLEKFNSETNQFFVLNVEFDLSPIDGIAISELKTGDLIGVRIIDDRPLGEYISNLLNAKDPDSGRPRTVYAVLKEFRILEDGGVLTTVEFGPGIYGKAYYGEDVKVKTVKKEELGNTVEVKKENFFIKNIWLIGGIFICLVIIIILIFLTRY
jgi:hypothetical protein